MYEDGTPVPDIEVQVARRPKDSVIKILGYDISPYVNSFVVASEGRKHTVTVVLQGVWTVIRAKEEK